MITRIEAITVVIPARDESELIGRCLESVLTAKTAAESRWHAPRLSIVVVADRCTDDTANVARGFDGVSVIEIDAANVGLARATGVMLALESSGLLPQHVWIASTDADSAVPRDWLTEQTRLARSGADVVLGTVRPDLDDLSDAQALAWATAHGRGASVGEVHGANLGVRADVYLAAGGFAGLAEHEDVDFVERCAALDADIVATGACEVTTSGRQVGRTPGGFARYLRDDLLTNPAL
ncbi:glycosyltransferase family A protein [Conyzicola nivalis]|uniref:4,4'-diaponeurosporenoate glycosyltransferase n=1 Tax=Conyzicola nivalis TaxID=1477021 RepID=A0A916SF51_9MICO|nr:glycosyltransferase [Conyzicola nivalis]GGA97484.1 glycosyl transferase [Conyzicola nivalis]